MIPSSSSCFLLVFGTCWFVVNNDQLFIGNLLAMSTPLREPAALQSSTSNTNAARQSTAGARRPTTPLRRISASSLRSLSLSHSRARPSTSTEPPLQHLGYVFAELADAFADLSASFEALDQINSGLDGFNESFGGYLYGLRVNSYCCDFENVRCSSLLLSVAMPGDLLADQLCCLVRNAKSKQTTRH